MDCTRGASGLQSATLLSSSFGFSSISSFANISCVAPRLNSRARLRIISLLDGKQSKSKNRRLSIPRCARDEVSTAEKETVSNLFTQNGSLSELQADNSKLFFPDLGSEKSDQKFDWLAQWYPVGVLKHMDKRQPQSVTVLGQDLVMWWDGAGSQWQVFADACPHRMAPLSEGRINEQGHLQCSYHGWSFSSSGGCTLIPQAPKEKAQQFTESKRACAKVYLSQHHLGMLWVFMDRSPGFTERALANPPPDIPNLTDPDFFHDVVMADFCYSYESLLENLLDPSHVHFAHHGVQGNRKAAKPLAYKVENFSKEGVTGGMGNLSRFSFAPPCLSLTDITLPAPPPAKGHPLALKLKEWIVAKRWGGEIPQRKVSTVFLCVPTVPGKSRLFLAFPRNFAKVVYNWTPRWLGHLVHMKVIDSDMYLLHTLDRRLEDGGGIKNIEKLYYTPAEADAYVVSFRKWLRSFGTPGYGPKSINKLPPKIGKRTALDRRSHHVVHCTICSGALRNFRKLEVISQVLPLFCMVLTAASNTKPLARLYPFRIPLLCLALITFFASKWFGDWINKEYEYHGYNHALIK